MQFANPTVRISAKASKPSKTHPRFEARSVFHCVAFSVRYQGNPALVASSMDIHFFPVGWISAVSLLSMYIKGTPCRDR